MSQTLVCIYVDCKKNCPFSYRNNTNPTGVRTASWECFRNCKKLKRKDKNANIYNKRQTAS